MIGNNSWRNTRKLDFARTFFDKGAFKSPSTLKSMSVATLMTLSSNGKIILY